jgi:hypothetical protein
MTRIANAPATKKVGMTPAAAAAAPQTAPPRAVAACEIMMIVAFIRPRAQSGIARWPAIQSSDDERTKTVHYASDDLDSGRIAHVTNCSGYCCEETFQRNRSLRTVLFPRQDGQKHQDKTQTVGSEDKLGPAIGIKSPPISGPITPEILICSPPSVWAEATSSLETISVTAEEEAGEPKANPKLNRNALARIT